ILPEFVDVLRERPDAVLSVAACKADVAPASINGGAQIGSGASARHWDPQMTETVANLKYGVVLMRSRGRPEERRTRPPPPDTVPEVKRDRIDWTKAPSDHGIEQGRIVLDRGFGFGKKFEGNYPLLAGLRKLHERGFPLLPGPSRKSFIGRTLA